MSTSLLTAPNTVCLVISGFRLEAPFIAQHVPNCMDPRDWPLLLYLDKRFSLMNSAISSPAGACWHRISLRDDEDSQTKPSWNSISLQPTPSISINAPQICRTISCAILKLLQHALRHPLVSRRRP